MINKTRPASVPQSDDQFFMDLHFQHWCVLSATRYDGVTGMSVSLPFEFEGQRDFVFSSPFDARLHRLVEHLKNDGEALVLHGP